MDLEDKGEIILSEEELENASGGKIQFDRFRYHCAACNIGGSSAVRPTQCPSCGGPVGVIEKRG